MALKYVVEVYNVIKNINMSLNELIDNILMIARNNNIAESEHLSRIQIEKWIISYRAMLIKQDIDKGRDINELYITTMGPIHISKIEDQYGKILYQGDDTLPQLIDFNYRTGVVNVKDMYGNLIQVGSQTKNKYQKYRKVTCGDYIAWIKNDKVYIENNCGDNQLEYIYLDIIAADPTELKKCFNPDQEFPIPAAMIPTITQMILEKELRVMTQMPSDISNNNEDNTQNKYSK